MKEICLERFNLADIVFAEYSFGRAAKVTFFSWCVFTHFCLQGTVLCFVGFVYGCAVTAFCVTGATVEGYCCTVFVSCAGLVEEERFLVYRINGVCDCCLGAGAEDDCEQK